MDQYAIIELAEKLENKKLIIFGTGSRSHDIYMQLKKLGLNIDYFVDNDLNKWESFFCGKKIKNPSTLLNESKNELIILIASIFDNEIATQLTKMQFVENLHFYSTCKNSLKGLNFEFTVGKHTYGHEQLYKIATYTQSKIQFGFFR